MKSITFQQAAVLFWKRTAGTFNAGNRLPVLFSRKKDWQFWKIFVMFPLDTFFVLPVRAWSTWTCKIQGCFLILQIGQLLLPHSSPRLGKASKFQFCARECSKNTHTDAACWKLLTPVGLGFKYLPWRPCLIILLYCVQLPEFSYL